MKDILSLKNGLHGSGWLQKDAIVRNPKFLDKLTKIQSEEILKNFPEVKLIVGPITGGALIASYIAKHLSLEYGVILGKQDPVKFHEMNIPSKDTEIVLVEDIISSGTDMDRFISFMKEYKVNLIGVSVWMNRRDMEIEKIKIINLLEAPFEIYKKTNCPLCKTNVPLKYTNIRE